MDGWLGDGDVAWLVRCYVCMECRREACLTDVVPWCQISLYVHAYLRGTTHPHETFAHVRRMAMRMSRAKSGCPDLADLQTNDLLADSDFSHYCELADVAFAACYGAVAAVVGGEAALVYVLLRTAKNRL